MLGNNVELKFNLEELNLIDLAVWHLAESDVNYPGIGELSERLGQITIRETALAMELAAEKELAAEEKTSGSAA